MDIRPADYLEHATIYFWDEIGSFSVEAERNGAHRPYPGRQHRNSTTRQHRCGGAARPGTAQATRRHP